MKNHIALHPEHGLNPTLKVCFFCGKETGELVLLGASYSEEAPRQMVTDFTPCEKCEETFSHGFLLVEAEETAKGPKPTGSHWLLTLEAADRLLINAEKNFPEHKAFITSGMAKMLGLYSQDKNCA